MPKYKYRARCAGGKTVRGVSQATDETELHRRLREKGEYLLTARPVERPKNRKRLKEEALAGFCRELGILLGAGIPLAQALEILSRNEGAGRSGQVDCRELLRRIRQGEAFFHAMESMGGIFPAMMIGVFRASEHSGNMSGAAQYLAEQYTKQYRLNERIRSSMAYPKLLVCLVLVVTVILTGYVLPQFEALFGMMEELPLPTRILYGIADFTGAYWMALVFCAAAGRIVAYIISRMAGVQLVLDRIRIRIPVFGGLWRMVYTARFARALNSLYSAGIPIVTAIETARSCIGNTFVERQFDQVLSAVRSGAGLSHAVGLADGLSCRLAHAIGIGEESGNLGEMLAAVAEELEYESELAAGRLVTVLEPLMIIIMGLVVGAVMIAVMMPIYASYSAMEASAYA